MLRRKDAIKASNALMIGGGLLIVGVFMVAFGAISFVALGWLGLAFMGLGVLLGLIGVGMILSTLLYGLKQERGDQNESEVTVLENVQITARFGINRIGETLFDADYLDFADPKTKLYIRIAGDGFPQAELRTNQAVWLGCGEGMRGRAHIQGDWLGQFEHRPGPPPTGNPYLK
jgi:hypothetical protein